MKARLALLAPIAFLLVWHALNRGYPRFEEADFVNTAMRIINAMRDDGVMAALRQLFDWTVRSGYQPILLPVVVLPFLLLTGGAVLPAVALAAVSTYAAICAYAFLLARRYVTEGRAVLAALFVVTSPKVFPSALTMNFALFHILTALAALYYLLESESFKAKRASLLFGGWLGLALCTRPIETFLIFAIPVTVAIYRGLGKRTIRPRDLLATAGVLVPTFLVLSVPILILNRHASWSTAWVFLVLPLSLLCGLLSLQRRLHLSRAYIAAFAAAFGIFAGWFFSSSYQLYLWVTRSLAPSWLGEITGTAGLGYAGRVGNLLDSLLVTPGFVGLCALGLLLGFLRAKRPTECKTATFFRVAAVACSLLIPHVLVGALTMNGVNQYYFAGYAVVLALLSCWVLRKSRVLPKLTLVAFVVLLFSQLVPVAATLVVEHEERLNHSRLGFGVVCYPLTPLRGDDPGRSLVNRLREQILRDDPKLKPKDRLRVCIAKIGEFEGYRTPFDVSAARAMLFEDGISWFLNNLWLGDDLEEKDRNNRASALCAYIVLGTIGETARISTPITQFANYLLRKRATGQLAQIGFKELAVIPTVTVSGVPSSVVLLKNLKGYAAAPAGFLDF